jgi:arsenate reductase-like glutaredoxin family protein
VLNTRSSAYRARNLGARKLTKSQAIDLMLEEPNLMRRPLVMTKRKAVFGYAPEEYDGL